MPYKASIIQLATHLKGSVLKEDDAVSALHFDNYHMSAKKM